MTTIDVPSMGDSITEGTIVQWLKSPGDSVAQDEVVVVLETDKVSIDVRAPEAGVLMEQLAKEGDSVEVGAPLLKLDMSATPSPSAGVTKSDSPASKLTQAAAPPPAPPASAAPKAPPSPAPKAPSTPLPPPPPGQKVRADARSSEPF
jgi:2-oxoglutarate dehydrogenase E2 component (dihydrolipoamide succinyltransferase)